MKIVAINITAAAVLSMAKRYHRLMKTKGMADIGLLSGQLLSPFSASVIGNAATEAIEDNEPFNPNDYEWDFKNKHVINKPEWAIRSAKIFIQVCKRENLLIDAVK